MDLKFDVKEKVEELVKKLQSDPSLLKNFEQDPIKTIEKLEIGRASCRERV